MTGTAKAIAQALDELGISAINFIDPEDKSPVAGISLADAAILVGALRYAHREGAHLWGFAERHHAAEQAWAQWSATDSDAGKPFFTAGFAVGVVAALFPPKRDEETPTAPRRRRTHSPVNCGHRTMTPGCIGWFCIPSQGKKESPDD